MRTQMIDLYKSGNFEAKIKQKYPDIDWQKRAPLLKDLTEYMRIKSVQDRSEGVGISVMYFGAITFAVPTFAYIVFSSSSAFHTLDTQAVGIVMLCVGSIGMMVFYPLAVCMSAIVNFCSDPLLMIFGSSEYKLKHRIVSSALDAGEFNLLYDTELPKLCRQGYHKNWGSYCKYFQQIDQYWQVALPEHPITHNDRYLTTDTHAVLLALSVKSELPSDIHAPLLSQFHSSIHKVSSDYPNASVNSKRALAYKIDQKEYLDKNPVITK